MWRASGTSLIFNLVSLFTSGSPDSGGASTEWEAPQLMGWTEGERVAKGGPYVNHTTFGGLHLCLTIEIRHLPQSVISLK